MRQFEDMPLDPDVLAELEAIDATLEGLSVDPFHAELAELALLVASEREHPSDDFTRSLDARAARRFAPTPSAARPAGRAASGRRWLRLPSRPVLGAALTGAFVLATAAVVIGTGALSTPSPRSTNGPIAYKPGTAPGQRSPVRDGGASAGSPAAGVNLTTDQAGVPLHAIDTTTTVASHSPAASSKAAKLGTASTNAGFSGAGAAAPTPASSTGTHITQSAQVQLSTPNAHIDQVAQEVFNLVALENGTVQSSRVTQANGGSNGGSYATFSLSIPTSNLQGTLNRMSSLRYANVASRTDGTQNVSNQYATDQRRITDDKALRTALLKELQAAYTQTAIDSIQAQLKIAENQLTSDERALGGLQHQISYSALSVQVNAEPIIHPLASATSKSHGFTIGKAAHDSVRVLVVMVGVALIGLAIMIPLGLLLLLAAWITFLVRGRRRERALDAS